MLVDNLRRDCSNLRLAWRIYTAFFATNEERVHLLNSISGTTSLIMQNALMHEVALRVCRLTDPKDSQHGKRKNTSIARLPAIVVVNRREELEKKVKLATESAEPIKEYRNRLLAHSDEDTRNKKTPVLTLGSRDDIENVIDKICDCVRFLYESNLDIHLQTDPISSRTDDEVQVIKALYLGAKAEKNINAEIMASRNRRDYNAIKEKLANIPDWVTHRDDQIRDR